MVKQHLLQQTKKQIDSRTKQNKKKTILLIN